MARKITAKQIEESLKKQLSDMGASTPHFNSLVEDYVFLWKQVQEMKKDIKEKGLRYTAPGSQGKEYEKDNPSVKNIVLLSRQMLAILKEMNLSTENAKQEDDDEL